MAIHDIHPDALSLKLLRDAIASFGSNRAFARHGELTDKQHKVLDKLLADGNITLAFDGKTGTSQTGSTVMNLTELEEKERPAQRVRFSIDSRERDHRPCFLRIHGVSPRQAVTGCAFNGVYGIRCSQRSAKRGDDVPE